MRQPGSSPWWVLAIVALLIVIAWPPRDDKSLAVKFVNWAVDPWDELPVLPEQLSLGMGDDPAAVDARDTVVRRYDALYLQGGWTRKRLELKVAEDPLNPSTERQLLLAVGIVTAFLTWRAGAAG